MTTPRASPCFARACKETRVRATLQSIASAQWPQKLDWSCALYTFDSAYILEPGEVGLKIRADGVN